MTGPVLVLSDGAGVWLRSADGLVEPVRRGAGDDTPGRTIVHGGRLRLFASRPPERMELGGLNASFAREALP